ncbi:hypothetical protein Gbem_0326 [Citrifermentans bemidjiense Bem]|uniref:Uncharacterized protein n=1 Tax=Citrifermentans bemidjiense (strain ATCC BAA-1014 / DSM 16622 / JCM 12645 / Bem) TaxID=404380 RepID=B5EAP8_CITBB|nr:hypothetical protein [Citrifermentans bemidjiense]ACH37357.2 hypothetical protein Gbem_0326 [Citrifermentans bemidjiense Bem]
MMVPELSPWSVLTASGALTAFHIGLYTLVGRERKSPYLINSAFPVFLLSLFVAALAAIASLLLGCYKSVVLAVSTCVLAGSFIYSLFVVLRLYTRFVLFVDSINPKHWPGIRHFRRWKKKKGHRTPYAHSSVPVPPEFEKKIIGVLEKFGINGGIFTRQEKTLKSLAVSTQNQDQCSELLAELALSFLKQGFTIQYMTASRHPVEFIEYLKKYMSDNGDDLGNYINKIVVIDAHSPHFGFTDSIYDEKTKELKSLNIAFVTSEMTYAGMHSATTSAFNTLESQMVDKTARQPSLNIYEGIYALTDLESPEQYRIFLRHVLPAERMWNSMFTVFVESYQPENDWMLLKAYASMVLDLRKVGSTENK